MLEHNGLTAMEARRRSQPGESKPPGAHTKPHDQEEHGEEANGDGNHHHEIHEREDGTAHSIHTHPDGHKEEMEHDSYADAVKHEHEQRGGEEMDDSEDYEDEHEPDGDEGGEDLAGMYSK